MYKNFFKMKELECFYRRKVYIIKFYDTLLYFIKIKNEYCFAKFNHKIGVTNYSKIRFPFTQFSGIQKMINVNQSLFNIQRLKNPNTTELTNELKKLKDRIIKYYVNNIEIDLYFDPTVPYASGLTKYYLFVEENVYVRGYVYHQNSFIDMRDKFVFLDGQENTILFSSLLNREPIDRNNLIKVVDFPKDRLIFSNKLRFISYKTVCITPREYDVLNNGGVIKIEEDFYYAANETLYVTEDPSSLTSNYSVTDYYENEQNMCVRAQSTFEYYFFKYRIIIEKMKNFNETFYSFMRTLSTSIENLIE